MNDKRKQNWAHTPQNKGGQHSPPLSYECYNPAGLPGTQLLTPGIGKGNHHYPRTTQTAGAGSLK